MLSLLDRYIIREIFPYFILSFFLLTSIIFVHEANRFSELFIIFSQNGLSSAPLFFLTLSLLPSIIIFTLPISFLLATLLGLGRLSGDSETVVMLASGIGPLQMLRPVMLAGFLVAGLTAYNTFYLLPISVNSLNQLKKTRTQIIVQSVSTQIVPGRFAENLPNKVIYIGGKNRDTETWNNIFIAEQSKESENKEPKIYTAKLGQLFLGKTLEETELKLEKSFFYNEESRQWDKRKAYSVSSSNSYVFGFDLSQKKKDENELNPEITLVPSSPDLMTFPQLLKAIPEIGKEKLLNIEIHKRIALPSACLVFAIIGIALGITLPRSGRSSGFFVGLITTLIYYLLVLTGERAAKQGIIPAIIGLWGANILIAIAGILILNGALGKIKTLRQRKIFWEKWDSLINIFKHFLTYFIKTGAGSVLSKSMPQTTVVLPDFGFPRIIDRMIFRQAVQNFLLILGGLSGIFIIFTLFELLNSVVQNKISIILVVEYLFFLLPQILNYMFPFAILVAILITFGILGKSSQLIALNSSGQSVYRLAVPILIGSVLSVAFLFAAQEYVLPFTNRTQEYLRYLIKGGQLPPQTFYQSNRKWFYGKDNRIFNFKHFDPNKNEFLGLAIYEINPETSGLVNRRYVKYAKWDNKTSEWILSKGWKRTFNPQGQTLESTEIKQEQLKIPEDPDYFKQEVSEITKMSIRELNNQIQELQHNGIDVLSLRIALQSKLASPFTCLIMALVGLPFSFTMGRRGALVGIGIGITIAVIFWGTIGIFNQLGNYELLPPFWAAWGPNLLFGTGGLYLLFTVRT